MALSVECLMQIAVLTQFSLMLQICLLHNCSILSVCVCSLCWEGGRSSKRLISTLTSAAEEWAAELLDVLPYHMCMSVCVILEAPLKLCVVVKQWCGWKEVRLTLSLTHTADEVMGMKGREEEERNWELLKQSELWCMFLLPTSFLLLWIPGRGV